MGSKPQIVTAAVVCLGLFVSGLLSGSGTPSPGLDVEQAVAVAVPLVVLLLFFQSARVRPVGGGTSPFLFSLLWTGGADTVVFSVLWAGAFGAFTLSARSLFAAVGGFLQQSLPLIAVWTLFRRVEPSGQTVAIAAALYLVLAVLVQGERAEETTTVVRLAYADILWAVVFGVAFGEGTALRLLALWSGVAYYSLLGGLEGEKRALSSQMSVARRTVESTRTKQQQQREKLTGLIGLQQRLDSYQEQALKAETFEQQVRVLQSALDEVTKRVSFAVVSESGTLLSQSRADFPVSEFLPLPSKVAVGGSIFSQDKERFVFGLTPEYLVLARIKDGGFSETEFAVVGHLLGRSTLLLQLFGQRERLAELVEQKSLALEQLDRSQKQLIQSGKMAAVGQLAAGVAHEINSPLAAITLQTDLGLRKLSKNDLEGAGKCLEVCKKASRRAKDIIENLLSFSRVSEDAATRVQIRSSVSEAMELVKGQFDGLGVATELIIPPELEVTADPGDLQHIFANIILNAYQALHSNPPTHPTLRVSARLYEDRVQVRFSNNGPAIDEEVAARIFEPFFTTKDVGAGTGLGLSLAFQMCEKNQGKIWLQQDHEVHFTVEFKASESAVA